MTSILTTIENGFEQLSPQLQIAARYVLGAPDDVAVYSMREIASRASVKPSTMARLSAKLAFENYNDFREAFRERVREPSSGYAARARKLQLRNGSQGQIGLVSDIRDAEEDNLERTLSAVSETQLSDAADCLVGAGTVHIVGLRKCASIASFFHYATRVILPQTALITGGAGLFAEEISRIEEGDAVLAIAFDPYTQETVQAVQAAKEVGAHVISITDSNVSPLARVADHAFIAANRSPSFYRSLSGALILVQALVASIVSKLGEAAINALEDSDLKLRRHNAYWKG